MNRNFVIFILFIFMALTGRVFSQNLKPDFSKVPGVVLAHSPASSGIYLGSPSIEIIPNGDYIASHDHFGPSMAGKDIIVSIYRSKDKGRKWKKVTEINRMFWAKLFYHGNSLYIIGCDSEYGRLNIRRSDDDGNNWTQPRDTNSGFLTADDRYHTAPMPLVIHNGRIWKAMEYNDTIPSSGWLLKSSSFVLSAPVNADLLKSLSWQFSEKMPFPKWELGTTWLEGNAVITPKGKIAIINRIHSKNDDTASYYELSKDGNIDKSTLRAIHLPGACKKFTIHYDKRTKLYWSLTNHSPKKLRGINHVERTRSTVALIYSPDLINWKIKAILLSHPDVKNTGFQYLDWNFEGNDIIALSRTAFDDGLGGANDCHNANFMTFHRFKNFRSATTPAKWKDLME